MARLHPDGIAGLGLVGRGLDSLEWLLDGSRVRIVALRADEEFCCRNRLGSKRQDQGAEEGGESVHAGSLTTSGS